MSYDTNNIFARMLRGEIPCNPLYENDYVLAFRDIAPKRKHHALVIPKAALVSFDDFVQHADANMQLEFFKAVQHVAAMLGLDKSGYRLIANHGADSGQEVPHFHVHILGGEPVGALVD